MGLREAQVVAVAADSAMPCTQNVQNKTQQIGNLGGGLNVDVRTRHVFIRVFKFQQKHAKEATIGKGKEQTGKSTGKTQRQACKHAHKNNTLIMQIRRSRNEKETMGKCTAPNINWIKIISNTRQKKERKRSAKTAKQQSRKQSKKNATKIATLFSFNKPLQLQKTRRENFKHNRKNSTRKVHSEQTSKVQKDTRTAKLHSEAGQPSPNVPNTLPTGRTKIFGYFL